MSNLIKRLIIGDIHGNIAPVKEIYNKEQPDEVILLGDYFDAIDLSDAEILYAFNEVLALRDYHLSLNKGDFIMLLGNHELHYLLPTAEYTGYRHSYAAVARIRLLECLEYKIIKYIHTDNKIKTVYSHAGLSNEWITQRLKQNKDTFPIECINELDLKYFDTNHLSGFSFYGDTPTQSPLWIRPKSLMFNAYSPYGIQWAQVFGHTHNTHISEMGMFYNCDTLPHEYLVEHIFDNGYKVERIIKQI